ncbi:MAG TPA: ribosome small subunit-dependent GTPase A [Acidimicrobiales bacterium]|nr:ribosome small subunit-dependent GTPase A [Acidimicrobiales bacterium]
MTSTPSNPGGPQLTDALHSLGADPALIAQLIAGEAAAAGSVIGRVSRVDRGRFQALTSTGTAVVATSGVSPVCVGDWCLLKRAGPPGSFELGEVHPRHTALVRQSSGSRTEVQALAANVDVVVIFVPLDRPISRRQIERFLALAWDSGAQPMIILTKADLVDENTVEEATAEVGSVSGDIPLFPASVVTGLGMETVRSYCTGGRTLALLGTSGSGKSSLINALMGSDVVQTGTVRDVDAKGRHTTTWRELLVLPTGGVLIDTPGLRELGMWIAEEGIEAVFTDITDLAEQCRFNDCAHVSEPDCAVLDAIATGALDPERLASYRKLLAEAAYAAGINDHRLARENQKVWRQRAAEGRRKARP